MEESLKVVQGDDISLPADGKLIAIAGGKPLICRFWRGKGVSRKLADAYRNLLHGSVPELTLPESGILVQIGTRSFCWVAQYLHLEKLPESNQLQMGEDGKWSVVPEVYIA